MRFLNNPLFYVRSFMFGVLILWVNLPFLMVFLRIQKLRFQESIHPQINRHFFIHSPPILAYCLCTHLHFIILLQHTYYFHLYIYRDIMCMYRNSVYMLFTLTISILTQCLPQIWNKFTLIITPPNLGQIFFEPRFLWMMLSYNLSQGSRR